MALDLARAGARVAITYRGNKVGADELVHQGRAEELDLKAYYVSDLASDSQTKRVFERVVTDFGQLDVVVANAGGNVASEDVHELDMAKWREVIEDNLLATVTTTKYAVEALDRNAAGGKIVLIGSVLGQDGAGNPRITAYSAAKAATHNFARTIAKALAPKIIVNVVSPGRCWSRGYEKKSAEAVAALFAPNKHGRPIEGAEIAHAVRMVLENDSIIGQVVSVEAGFTLMAA